MQDVILGIYIVLNVPLHFCILLGKCFIYLIHSKSPCKQIEFIAFKTFSNKQASCERKLSLFEEPNAYFLYELWQPI